MQVPRVVEKRVPYTYTVRTPRTVVMKVPLDPCGNPLPTAAAAARPAAPATPAPVLAPAPSGSPAPAAAPAPAAGPVKTFSDKPADAAPKTAEGWDSSPLDHVDPERSAADDRQAVRAEKPAAAEAGEELRKIEAIPAPAAKEPAAQVAPEPTVAPPGPAVYPPPPASDARDVPTAKTSGTSLPRPVGPRAHST
jgi:Meckel syndrome type 1 protein